MCDLLLGLGDSAADKAAVSSAWTGAFSLGALLGPVSCAIVADAFGFDLTCVVLAVGCVAGGISMLLALASMHCQEQGTSQRASSQVTHR